MGIGIVGTEFNTARKRPAVIFRAAATDRDICLYANDGPYRATAPSHDVIIADGLLIE